MMEKKTKGTNKKENKLQASSAAVKGSTTSVVLALAPCVPRIYKHGLAGKLPAGVNQRLTWFQKR